MNIDEIKAGCEPSFTMVFDQFHGKLYHYFMRKTGSGEMARELVQLTFIKLWRFRHTLSPDLPFDSQLFTMATSCMIDHLRHQHSLRKKITAISSNTELMDMPAEGAVQGFEHADYLRSAMRSLSPVRKKVFMLSRFYGHSYREIANELSISVKTVEDHISKALKHIRSVIVQSFLLFLIIFFLFN